MEWQITVDPDRCNGCGECADNCPGEVYRLEEGRAVPVDPAACHGCHTCEELCPEGAVTVEEGGG